MSSGPEENRAPQQGLGEDEPLLGRAGDASQQEGRGIQFNPVIGTLLDHSLGQRDCTDSIF